MNCYYQYLFFPYSLVYKFLSEWLLLGKRVLTCSNYRLEVNNARKSKKTVREKSLKYAGKNCWFSSLLWGFKCWSFTNGGLLHLEHVQVLYIFEQFHLIDAWEPQGLCFWETRLFLGPGLTSNYLENNFYLTTTFNSSWGKGVCFAVTSFSVGKFESQIN